MELQIWTKWNKNLKKSIFTCGEIEIKKKIVCRPNSQSIKNLKKWYDWKRLRIMSSIKKHTFHINLAKKKKVFWKLNAPIKAKLLLKLKLFLL